jgi:septum site-determining protein MinC
MAVDTMTVEETSLVQIKGMRDGLLVTLGSSDWNVILAALIAQIDAKSDFFKGARMALDVGEQVLHVSELSSLRDQLSDRGITLWAVLSGSSITENTAQMLGLATRLSRPKPGSHISASSLPAQAPEDSALWVKKTLRSGVRVEHAGNVVVLGDMNPGSEIIADGCVIVWGRLRGVVHAGAHGDNDAVVCALDLSPTQLRISGEIATTPSRKGNPYPEMARIKNGQITAEPWQQG